MERTKKSMFLAVINASFFDYVVELKWNLDPQTKIYIVLR